MAHWKSVADEGLWGHGGLTETFGVPTMWDTHTDAPKNTHTHTHTHTLGSTIRPRMIRHMLWSKTKSTHPSNRYAHTYTHAHAHICTHAHTRTHIHTLTHALILNDDVVDANDLSRISKSKLIKHHIASAPWQKHAVINIDTFFRIATNQSRSYSTLRQLKTSVSWIMQCARQKRHKQMWARPFTLIDKSIPWQYILHVAILDAKESTGVSIIKVDKASSPWVTFGTRYYNGGISPQWSPSDIHEAWHLPRNRKLQNMNNVSWWRRTIFLDHPRGHQIR